MLHVSQTLCAICEPYFMHYMQTILHVLHNSKKHTSQTLCAACELTGIVCQISFARYGKNQGIQLNNM